MEEKNDHVYILHVIIGRQYLTQIPMVKICHKFNLLKLFCNSDYFRLYDTFKKYYIAHII